MTIETSNGVIIGPTIGPAIAECRTEPVAAEFSPTSSRFLLLTAAIIVVFWLAYQALAAMVAGSDIVAMMIAP